MNTSLPFDCLISIIPYSFTFGSTLKYHKTNKIWASVHLLSMKYKITKQLLDGIIKCTLFFGGAMALLVHDSYTVQFAHLKCTV